MMLEIPSGPDAVLILWVDSSLRTSSWLLETFDSVGVGGDGKVVRGKHSHIVKQEVKKSFGRFAFLAEVLAFVPFRLRLGGVRVYLGLSLWWCDQKSRGTRMFFAIQ